jgi:copper chaperone CopZ
MSKSFPIAMAVSFLSFAAACGGEPAAPALPKAPVVADAKATIDLGREMTCQNCVATVRKALEPVAGVGELTIAPGTSEFVVAYDSKQTKPADIAAALVAAGEKGAKPKP